MNPTLRGGHGNGGETDVNQSFTPLRLWLQDLSMKNTSVHHI